MSKSSTLALCSTLTLGQTPPSQFSHYYDESIYALGALPYLFEAARLPVDPLQALFLFPDNFLTALSIWYDNRTLDFMSHAELLALSPTWQDHRGPPVAYTDDNLSLRTFRLYPIPEDPSQPMVSILGGPFGQSYPLFNAVLLGTVFRVDIPPWMELPLIYSILARDYARESPYQDLTVSSACMQVSQLLMGMLHLPSVE